MGMCGSRSGKPRDRALLVALLLHRERVAFPVIVWSILVWGESPPRTVNAAVYNSISQLRHSLGPERLVGDGGAYRLVVGEGELDSDRFEALVGAWPNSVRGRRSRSGRAALLGEALGVVAGRSAWRTFAIEPFAQDEIRRLE